jgi:hypothetical protein
MSTSEPEVARLADAMLGMLRAEPRFFIDLVRAFPEVPYRAVLLAWGQVRERVRLARDEDGRYLAPPAA